MNPPTHDRPALDQPALERPGRLADLLAALPDGPARYHDETGSLDAAGLRAEVTRVAALFTAQGLKHGDRLAIWLPNGLPWLISFLAAARLGIVVLAVNTRFRSADLAAVLGQADCRALLYRPGYRGIDFNEILAAVPASAIGALTQRFVVPEPGEPAPFGIDWTQPPSGAKTPVVPASAEGAPDAGTVRGDDDAVIFTTSGTTSLPKLVVHDQHGLVLHGQAIASALAIDAGSTILLAAPLCGTFGLSSALPALASGAGLVLDAGLKAADLARAITRHRVTHSFCNNALLADIFTAADAGGLSLASLRRVGFASFAPSLDGLPERARAHGVRVTGLYGSSELQALVAAQPPEAADAIRHLPGGRLVAPEARVRARDPVSGALLAPGVAGAIEIRAPSLMRRYTSPEATRAALTDDGYFRTGDVGAIVDERHFVFHARMGDALRLGGFLVNPKEIEDWLTSRPDVAACQVVGVEQDGAMVAVAFVIPATTGAADSGPTPDALLDHCRQGLARYKQPRAIWLIDAFPTVAGANGDKIQRHALQAEARRRLDSDRPA